MAVIFITNEDTIFLIRISKNEIFFKIFLIETSKTVTLDQKLMKFNLKVTFLFVAIGNDLFLKSLIVLVEMVTFGLGLS